MSRAVPKRRRARAAAIRGHDAAHRGALRAGWIERQHLALGGQDGAQLTPRRAGGDADGEVARFVLQNAAQLVETQIDNPRGRRGGRPLRPCCPRRAETMLCPAASRVLQGFARVSFTLSGRNGCIFKTGTIGPNPSISMGRGRLGPRWIQDCRGPIGLRIRRLRDVTCRVRGNHRQNANGAVQ